MGPLEGQLLDAPIEQFGDEKLVFAGAGNFMDPAQFAELFAGFAEDAENFSIESQLVDAAGKSIRGIKNLIGRRCDTEGPGSAGRHRACGGSGLVADSGAGIRGNGYVNRELADKFPGSVEDLDAAVAAVGDINVVLCIHCNAVRSVELAGLSTGFAPRHQPVAVFIYFRDARIDIPVADVDRKSTRLNSSHLGISYAVFCLK